MSSKVSFVSLVLSAILRDVIASANDKNDKHYNTVRLPICVTKYLLCKLHGYPVNVFPAFKGPEGSLPLLNSLFLDSILSQFCPVHVLTQCLQHPF